MSEQHRFRPHCREAVALPWAVGTDLVTSLSRRALGYRDGRSRLITVASLDLHRPSSPGSRRLPRCPRDMETPPWQGGAPNSRPKMRLSASWKMPFLPTLVKSPMPPGAAMSGFDQKVLIASLWERTSAKGNTYFSGFLGKACIVGFRGEPSPDGTPTWNLYLVAGQRATRGCR